MKHLILILSFLLVFTSISFSQNPVMDTHPESIIKVIDYSTGQEAQTNTDAAILFKDAFIELASHTTIAKISAIGFGRKFWEIQQLDPQTDGNAYQLMFHRQIGNQISTNYTFVYNVDQNKLSWFNPQTQEYLPMPVQGSNINNLNNCFAYGKFNIQAVQPVAEQTPPAAADQGGPQPAIDASADSVTANIAPPQLQDEVQPECPTEGYLWQPGNWAFNVNTGQYYWVPGVWAAPVQVGYLWTPAYWGFENGVYLYHGGYWGATVGFYGGLNFGYGYAGEGFVGGRWEDGHFRYNTAIMRGRFHYGYEDRSAVFAGRRNYAGFNGRGGIERGPSMRERAEFDRRNNDVVRARAVQRTRIDARAGGAGPCGAGAARPGAVGPVRTGAVGGSKLPTSGGSKLPTSGGPKTIGGASKGFSKAAKVSTRKK